MASCLPRGEVARPIAPAMITRKRMSIVGGGVKCSAPRAAARPVAAIQRIVRQLAIAVRRRSAAATMGVRRPDQYTPTMNSAATKSVNSVNATRRSGDPGTSMGAGDMVALLGESRLISYCEKPRGGDIHIASTGADAARSRPFLFGGAQLLHEIRRQAAQ